MAVDDDTAPPEAGAGGAAIALPASLDLTEADGLCQALRQALQSGAVILDADAVERVSTPCLQVLAAAAASAASRGIQFRLCRASEALATAIGHLGLGAAIPLED